MRLVLVAALCKGTLLARRGAQIVPTPTFQESTFNGQERNGRHNLHTWEANRHAVSAYAKAVSEALRSLGKRCSVRWVNRQCEPSSDVRRTDYYGAFWRWFEALWMANRAGADFLYEDLRARVHLLREGTAHSGDWYEQLALCEEEHSEAIRAAILNRDEGVIRKELIEAIAALRRQLALLDARERHSQSRAA